jgi:hypothetical protein
MIHACRALSSYSDMVAMLPCNDNFDPVLAKSTHKKTSSQIRTEKRWLEVYMNQSHRLAKI